MCTAVKHPVMATFVRLNDGTTGSTFGPDERTYPGSTVYLLIDGATRMESESGGFSLDSALGERLRRAPTIDLSWRALDGGEYKQSAVKLTGIGSALDECVSRVATPR